jgi:hypothetical protein
MDDIEKSGQPPVTLVETPSAHFMLSPEVKSIVLQSAQGSLNLRFTESGLVLQVEGNLTFAASGEVKIEGSSVTLSAQGSLDMRSQGTVHLEGVETTIQGAIVKIN